MRVRVCLLTMTVSSRVVVNDAKFKSRGAEGRAMREKRAAWLVEGREAMETLRGKSR